MTDKEIIKGFETCGITCGCSECPYAGVSDDCLEAMKSDALDLINRLKAENDDLKRDAIPKLQSSLDRANKYGIETEKENERLKAEIERLKSKVNRLKRYDEERDIRLHARLIATAKSEAYKEFAERLLRKATIMRDEPQTNGVVRVGHIYETLEEMGLTHDT